MGKPLCNTRTALINKIKVNVVDMLQMYEFFSSIWKKRNHYSEISGTYLGKDPLSIYFHHILSKEKYPEAMFDEENIVLLTLDEHTDIENNMYKFEDVNEQRNYLKTKYNL
jgi:hypothetical protein